MPVTPTILATVMVKKIACLAFGVEYGRIMNSLGTGQVGLALLIAVNRPDGANGLNLHPNIDVARPCNAITTAHQNLCASVSRKVWRWPNWEAPIPMPRPLRI
jgi:hypothetical protein